MFLNLTRETNPKLAIEVNTSLFYKSEDGELKEKQPTTALTTVVKEAGKVAALNKGSVTISFNTNEGWKTYFCNKNDSGIVLVPSDSNLQKNTDNYLFFDKKPNLEDRTKIYYSLNKTPATQSFIENIKINFTDKSKYLAVRAYLKNDEIKNVLIEKEEVTTENHVAIISKDGYEILTNSELQNLRKTNNNEIPVNKDDEASKELLEFIDKQIDQGSNKADYK